MDLPARLIVQNCAVVMDGGTKVLLAIDEGGSDHSIMLGHHNRPEYDPSSHIIPGRMIFDGTLVPIRSDLEAEVLRLLRSAEAEDSVRSDVAELIGFVESDKYLSFAARVKQPVETSYHWPDWRLNEMSQPGGRKD